jgi:hypothetical protein
MAPSADIDTSSTRSREIAQINQKLDKSLAAYMLAAGAASISLLAAPSAEAEIIYTPAHTTIGPHTSLLLDVNHDGVKDFLLTNWSYDEAAHLGINKEATANGILGHGAPLPAGLRIGPKGAFVGYASMATNVTESGESFSGGQWKHTTNRYLGLKFSINGETHYGWARLTVNAKDGIVATLTGYAYENVPNKPIMAGETSGPVAASLVSPEEMPAASYPSSTYPSATLAMIARGADALAIWRRDHEV